METRTNTRMGDLVEYNC